MRRVDPAKAIREYRATVLESGQAGRLWSTVLHDPSDKLPPDVRAAFIRDYTSTSRTYLYPFLRPVAVTLGFLAYLFRLLFPRLLSSTRAFNVFAGLLVTYVCDIGVYWITYRHVHLSGQVSKFIIDNLRTEAPILEVAAPPEDVPAVLYGGQELFAKHVYARHDLVSATSELRAKQGEIFRDYAQLDYSAITSELPIPPTPIRWCNRLDLHTTGDFFIAALQWCFSQEDYTAALLELHMDHTVASLLAELLQDSSHLSLLNNKNPLFPGAKVGTSRMLLLHLLYTEQLHALISHHKARAAERGQEAAK
ncbi:MAG: hypothetical protein H6741_13095 [Alphaproteobacteria bacterium]|nr:hypothetical protein [Alphaproteobacteria bacterium]